MRLRRGKKVKTRARNTPRKTRDEGDGRERERVLLFVPANWEGINRDLIYSSTQFPFSVKRGRIMGSIR